MTNRISEKFIEIVNLIKELRGPDGCSWDREQTLHKLSPIILEEVHEVIEALDNGNAKDLSEELGDLFWDIIFIINIAEDEKLFTLEEVLKNLAEKIVRRHPHVWGPDKTTDREKIKDLYHNVKKKDYSGKRKGHFDGISKTLPALYKALKIIKKAQKAELKLPENKDLEKKAKDWDEEKWGEFLFQASILSRKKGIDLEQALRIYSEKFIKDNS